MKLKFLYFLLFLSVFTGFSQSEIQSFSGKILEFEKPISGVHIYNLNILQGTTSDSDGLFTIQIKENDTLLISHVKYKTLRVVVSKYYLEIDGPVQFFIEEMTNYLEMVTITNHDLQGSLESDSEEVPKDTLDKSFRSLSKLPSFKDYERDLAKPHKFTVDPTGGTGGSGVTLASQKFSRKSKEQKLRKELYLKRTFPDRIIADLGVNYFTKTLKIPSDQIYHFLTYCDFKGIIDLYYENNIMSVLNILKEESTEYVKIKY